MHIPVLLNEVLEYLEPKSRENFIDGTVGECSHTRAILEKNGPDGKVLGIEWDAMQVKNSKEHLKEFDGRAIVAHGSYANMKEIARENTFEKVDGILLDVGMSSWQLENSNRGFTFQKDQVLDMRYDVANKLTAAVVVNEYSQLGIEKILEELGEEKFAKQIAKAIVIQRGKKEIKSTFELKTVIEKAVPIKFQHGGIHCATRTFQALRIAVNGELENLKSVLPDAVSILSFRGRLVVISFHSLEDRIVKNAFRDMEKAGAVKILTKKPIEASLEEIRQNPRARSAKLRAAVKI